MEWGLIEKYSEKDWILWWENRTFIKKQNPYQTLDQFNQLAVSNHSMSCVIYGFMGSVMYNTSLSFCQDEVETAATKAIEDWTTDPSSWTSFIWGANFIRNYIRNQYWVELIQYRFDLQSDAFFQGLENWWSFAIWYRTSSELRNDVKQDWVAWKDSYPTDWIWHLVHYIYKDGENVVINSYYWEREHNIFKFKNFKKLVEDGLFFPFGYILLPNEIDEMSLPEHIKPENIENHEDQQIVLEWKRIVDKAIKEHGHEPIYNEYTDNQYLTKMLIEISYLRIEYGRDF